MIVFWLIASAMALAAIAAVTVPLLRSRESESPARNAAVLSALVIPLAATVLYLQWSEWSWDTPGIAPEEAEIRAMVEGLSARLEGEGGTAEEWQMLGRSRMVLDEPERAAEAYRQAYRESRGADVETIVGYAEALIASDPQALAADAGDLMERALQLAPDHPRALWYGGLAALERGRFAAAEARFATLLAAQPPPAVRAVLEDRLAAARRGMGGNEDGSTQDAPGGGEVAVEVEVSVVPELAQQLEAGAALFIFARSTEGAGPPLAVVRRRAGELPLSVRLSDADAMLEGRTISSQEEIEIVARVALGGSPTAQSGDLFGSVRHRLAAGEAVEVRIDRVHP